MNREMELAEQASYSLIAADLKFFHGLAFNPRLGTLQPIAMLALMPFLSGFVMESATLVERTGLVPTRDLKPHESLLRSSRLRFKLLYDKLDEDELVADINRDWFFSGHRGILGPLKRLLQSDLGVFFAQRDVICTTHIALLNLGLTEEKIDASSLSLDNLGQHLHDVTVDYGRYAGLLVTALNLSIDKGDNGPLLSAPLAGSRDLDSHSLYGTIARRVAAGDAKVSRFVLSIVSQVNTARLIVPAVATDNEIAKFKVRFVSLFHAALSLQKLLDQNRTQRYLQPDVERQIREILGTPPVRNVRKNKDLRDNLVHYGVPEHTSRRLHPGKPLFGLVEAYSSGRTLDAVANDVALGLDSIASGLGDLLPPTLTPQKML